MLLINFYIFCSLANMLDCRGSASTEAAANSFGVAAGCPTLTPWGYLCVVIMLGTHCTECLSVCAV